MLIWVIALHCEAKPIIDLYRLKKSSRYRTFDLYENNHMQCVISGIGKTSAAAATAWVGALNHRATSTVWINLGIAGAATQPVGEIFWLHKITDPSLNRRYYPIPIFPKHLKSIACISLDQPDNDYDRESVYDMEASAFFATATRFSSGEQVHCLKVISDNQQQAIKLDKPGVSQLIQQKSSIIHDFTQNLLKLNQQLVKLEVSPILWQQVLQQAHFSQTQQAQLKTLLRFLSPKMNDALPDLISHLQSSQRIIETLQQHCFRLSHTL